MSADEHQLTPAEQTICDALVGAYLRDPHLGIDSDGRARAIVARLRPLLAAEVAPDIVTGEQARALPSGSRVVIVDACGVPEAGRRVHDVDDARNGFGLGCRYLVLHRAPAPAPKVGDVVTTVAQLDALPVNAALRVGGPGGLLVTKIGPAKVVTAGHGVDLDECLAVGMRVLDLGADS